MASLTFPVTADQNYKDAFNAMARKKRRTMAELVREALDEKYGADLMPYLSFFEKAVDLNQHVVTKETANG